MLQKINYSNKIYKTTKLKITSKNLRNRYERTKKTRFLIVIFRLWMWFLVKHIKHRTTNTMMLRILVFSFHNISSMFVLLFSLHLQNISLNVVGIFTWIVEEMVNWKMHVIKIIATRSLKNSYTLWKKCCKVHNLLNNFISALQLAAEKNMVDVVALVSFFSNKVSICVLLQTVQCFSFMSISSASYYRCEEGRKFNIQFWVVRIEHEFK